MSHAMRCFLCCSKEEESPWPHASFCTQGSRHASPASLERALRAHSFFPGATISLEGYREELEVSRRDRPAFQTLRECKGLLKLRDTKSLGKARVTYTALATISTHNWKINHWPYLGKEFLSNAVIGTSIIFSEK